MTPTEAADRLRQAERQGLRLAIICRTAALAMALLWYVLGSLWAGYAPRPTGLAALLAFTLLGIAAIVTIGTRSERWWLKYLIYAADILGICALFVWLPVSSRAEIPQIVAFRAYGIYYLFPLIAMACLSLSWRLVAWSGVVAVVGWWTAFAIVVAGMERRLSWRDLSAEATAGDYEAVFLSIDFIGTGNRVEETGFLLTAALVLAYAVYRARRVFFAQIAAEAERERERAERERISLTLGRYVPEAIAARLIADPDAMTPQVRHGAVLILDVQGFTAFAAGRPPAEVIAALDAFLAACADAVTDHDGVVISFTGDGLLATFNTPLEHSHPERAAYATGRALVAVASDKRFGVRIGIAAGPVAAGSIGSSRRQAFTVYGDTVNRAARLEALAKDLGETLLVDDGVAEHVDDTGEAALRPLGPQAVRGLAAPVTVWAGPPAPHH